MGLSICHAGGREGFCKPHQGSGKYSKEDAATVVDNGAVLAADSLHHRGAEGWRQLATPLILYWGRP